MKIHVGHDYYDSVLAYGADPDVRFVREKNHVLSSEQVKQIPQLVPHVPHLYFSGKRGAHHTSHGSIPFQDSYAHVSGVSAWVGTMCWHGYKVKFKGDTCVHWNLESLVKWAQEDQYQVLPANRYWMLMNHKPEVQAGSQETPSALQAWMIQNHVTVITHDHDQQTYTWRVNGDNLRDLQLYKIQDAHSMYQLIYQWVAGVLPSKGNPMVEITDDLIKAHKHGFDKFSFRKPKQK